MNPMKMKMYFREPKSMRMEMQVAEGGSTTIFDGTRGRMLTLDPARKSAIVLEMANPKEDFVTKTVESIRNLPGKDARPEIDDQLQVAASRSDPPGDGNEDPAADGQFP